MAGYPFLRPPRQSGDLGELGGYRILQLLGDGAMGFVFLAQEKTLDRRLALKVMRPEYSATPEGRERFLREARASAKVESDHVVTIYQVGEDNSTPFIAMELLEGMSLQTWLARRESLPSIASVMKVARDLFRGLADAHAQGLVHRDIKPSNLWIEKRTGRIKILDFGLTKAGDGADNATRSGAILGTPAYMAPEQANGQPVDQRADLFSAGVVLYEVLTKKNPFRRGSILATLKAIGSEEAPPVAGVRQDTPPALAGLVDKLLRRECQERPAEAIESQRLLALAEQEYRILSGKAQANLDEPPSAVREVTETQAKPNDDQQSDHGSFLFDTNGFSPAKTAPNALLISAQLKKCLFGAGIAAVLLLGFLYFRKFSNKPAQEKEQQANQGTIRYSDQGSSVVVKNDDVVPPFPKVVGSGESEKQKEPTLPRTGGPASQKEASAILNQVSAELLRKNPGIKEPELVSKADGNIHCRLEGAMLEDLSPLADVEKLALLEIIGPSLVSDLSPLKKKPIEKLTICHAKISDLSPLKGMPIKALALNSNKISSIEPLAGMPIVYLELNGNPELSSLDPLRACPIESIRFIYTKVSSLDPLQGKQVKFLEITGCPISDISPLAGMPLEVLNFSGTKVLSIDALKNCPINILLMTGAKVQDLSPLNGKKIQRIELGDVSGVSLNPLRGLPFLEDISGLPEPVDSGLVASWPKVKIINKKEKNQLVMANKASTKSDSKETSSGRQTEARAF